MLFVELRFLAFFAVVIAVTWALQVNRHRKLWLLLASYFFYANWDWRFLSLILLSTAVDFVVGLRLATTVQPKTRKHLLAASLFVNLGMLGIFKYYNFFAESFGELATAIGFPVSQLTLDIVLPVGISFYTFQTLSYTIDIYRRQLKPTDSLLDFALFVGFFPQLVAGPIVRAKDFLHQLHAPAVWRNVDLRWALVLFLVGWFKKAVVADNFAPFADAFFSDPTVYGPADAWLHAFIYTVQLYCDFSGYTDMAIASAALLGYRLRNNFNFPYFASNVSETWGRWHMSLSTWMRDYVYFSLGGNRGSRMRVHINSFVTMTLSGLWHGAGWHYIVWGMMQGAAIAINREWKLLGLPSIGLPGTILAIAATYIFWTLSVMVFRAPDMAAAWQIYTALAGKASNPETVAAATTLWVLYCVLIAGHFAAYRNWFAPIWQRAPVALFASGYGVAWTIALALRADDYQAFIYFQF